MGRLGNVLSKVQTLPYPLNLNETENDENGPKGSKKRKHTLTLLRKLANCNGQVSRESWMYNLIDSFNPSRKWKPYCRKA